MTDPTIATPEEILTAVERWARAAGFHARGTRPPPPRQWSFEVLDGQAIVYPMRNGARGHGERVNPATAIAWALCVDAGVTVDVGRCPACETRGCGPGRRLAMFEWRWLAPADWSRNDAVLERAGWVPSDEDFDGRAHLFRPCPTCNADPSYRHIIEAARLVLDAAPRHVTKTSPEFSSRHDAEAWAKANRRPGDTVEVLSVVDVGAVGEVFGHVRGLQVQLRGGVEPGDPKAREALAVRVADELAGTPAGHAIAHWLALWTHGDLRETRPAVYALTAAWERLTVPCGRCEETGRVTRYSQPTGVPVAAGELEVPGPGFGGPFGAGVEGRTVDCPDCDGNGRAKPKAADAEYDAPLTVRDLDHSGDGRSLRLLRAALSRPEFDSLRGRASAQDWWLDQVPERLEHEFVAGLVIRYRWAAEGGWRLRADVHVDIDIQAVSLGRVDIRVPDMTEQERPPFAQEYYCIPAPPEPEVACVLCGEPIREGQATHAQVAHWACAQEHRRRRDAGVPAMFATDIRPPVSSLPRYGRRRR